MEERREYDNKVDTFYNKLYKEPSSGIFLDTNTRRIFEAAKQDARIAPVSRADIERFKLSIESISRNRQRRTIGNRSRHLSFRRWKCFAPKCIVAADLAFLRGIRKFNEQRHVILVIINVFRYEKKMHKKHITD